MSLHEWYRRRERGLPPRIGDADLIYRTIFRSLQPRNFPNELIHPCHYGRESGAICNLEFSPDGTMLIAACEYKSIVLFDPLTEKQIYAVNNAHDGSVNCVKFIDSHVFATCSDDTTVALWDTRNLSTKLRTLNGHSGWVKNIEYAKQQGILISSGLDGVIYAWELKNSTEQGCIYQRLLYMPGLMRCRLAPAEDRLVLCTSTGCLMIVHDLNLATLAGDLVGFRPSIHRLNLMRKQRFPSSTRTTPAISYKRKNNRIEFVSDFPPGDNAELISGLTIHPQGWCALSRNVSYDEKSEWSVVHDIQCWSADDESNNDEEKPTGLDMFERPDAQDPQQDRRGCVRWAMVGPSQGTVECCGIRRSSNRTNNAYIPPEQTGNTSWGVNDEDNTNVMLRCPNCSGSQCPNLRSGSYLKLSSNNRNVQDRSVTKYLSRKVTNVPLSEAPVAEKRIQKKAPENETRLLYYIQESNKVEGYMREACFSPDGRVICSPHDEYGIRLLAFNEHCNELQYARNIMTNGEPQVLRELKYKPCHPHVVVSSQFSPRFPLLVTGCLLGNVVWNLPVLN